MPLAVVKDETSGMSSLNRVKSNTSKLKSYKSPANSKKKKIKNKAKKIETKASQKTETKASKNSYNDKSIYPSVDTAFKALLSARFCAAMWSHISDCDETFNYWEPSHFLLYGKGFQSWEYNPEYALRSYTYLLLHVVPAWIYANILQPNRMLIFYFLRCSFRLFCAFCETYFYKSVCKEFGINVGRMVLIFLVFSPGMFISSTVFLPSSFSMYMCSLSIAAWINKKYELAILSTALSTFISWPFAAFIGVPIALDMLVMKNYYKKFIQWSIISSIIILVPLIRMDSGLYGKLVIAPLNIILYNVFTSHGPNLYGTEPICFYFINGVLNFNLVFVAANVAPSFILLRNFIVHRTKRKGEHFTSWLILSPFYIWFIVFTLQPHKEERFLFPVYPLVCLCGAICIHSVQIIYSALIAQIFGKNSRRLANSQAISVAAILLFIFLSISRVLALYKGYHAPMDLYMELNKYHAEGKVEPNVPINVCVGKEWYRFPSSFFLPNNDWNLKFIHSEFKGQLPAKYSQQQNSTAIVHSHFNDLNKEESSRYFDLEKCHFLIDCDYGKVSKLEPDYSSLTDKWSIVKSLPFLNSEKSHAFFRAFYIPFLSEQYCTYAKYNLLQSTKFKFKESTA